MTINNTSTMNKLAIIVVYYLNDADIDVLDIHLQSIIKNTHSNYTIYGVANRVSDTVKQHLEKYKNLELVSLESFNGTGSEEHSFYLDKLINYAINSGQSTHICTLDCDSFPIKENWEQSLYKTITNESPVTAVSRVENGDTFLPHPSMTFFASDFYIENKFEFFPSKEKINEPSFQNFLFTTKQKIDSGIGLAYLLYSKNIKWTPLLRSNKHNDHFLLAGIYGDLIFHLGSMSWSNRDFRKDRSESFRIQLAVFIRNKIIHCPVGSFRRQLLNLIEQPALDKIKHRNQKTYKNIRQQLNENSERYMNYLQGISNDEK